VGPLHAGTGLSAAGFCEAEPEVVLLNGPLADNYLDSLGKELAAHAPGYKYPYQYRCVNDENIKAFA
jgi:predicted Zn-dependent protease